MSPHVGWNLSRAPWALNAACPAKKKIKELSQESNTFVFPYLELASLCSMVQNLENSNFTPLPMMDSFPPCTWGKAHLCSMHFSKQINFFLKLFELTQKRPPIWWHWSWSFTENSWLCGVYSRTQQDWPQDSPARLSSGASHSQLLQPCNFPDDLRFWKQMKQRNCLSC